MPYVVGEIILFSNARGNNNGISVYFLTTCIIVLNRSFYARFFVMNFECLKYPNAVIKSPFLHTEYL